MHNRGWCLSDEDVRALRIDWVHQEQMIVVRMRNSNFNVGMRVPEEWPCSSSASDMQCMVEYLCLYRLREGAVAMNWTWHGFVTVCSCMAKPRLAAVDWKGTRPMTPLMQAGY